MKLTTICFTALFIVVSAYSNVNTTHSTTFHIKPNQSDSKSVELQIEQNTYKCTFTFDTSVTSQTENPNADSISYSQFPPASDIIKTIHEEHKAQCLESHKGDWSYKVCIGDKVSQYNSGSSFDLGLFVGTKSAIVHDNGKQISTIEESYEGGTKCDSNVVRGTAVRYACGPFSIISVDEPSMCQYAIVIGTPLVCKHPSFVQHATSSLSQPKGDEQAWWMQIAYVQSSVPSIVCTAQHSSYGNISPLTFSLFDLTFGSQVSLNSFKARHPQRIPFGESEISVKQDGVSNSQPTTLHFVSISAKI